MRLPDLQATETVIHNNACNDYIQHHYGRSLEELLAPIGENQVGESVRHNGVYFQIKEARREDDPTLPQGVWAHELKVADWEQVERTALEALCHKSKDLQLGVWLMESSINRYGFAGIAPAAVLLRGLCESYWETMHPQMLDGDIEFRTNPINWVNEKLSLRLRLLPITHSQLDGVEFCWDDWDNAQRFEMLKQQSKGQTLNWDSVTVDLFKQRLAATSNEFLWQLCEDIDDARQALDSLLDWLDVQCGHDSPSLGEITRLIGEIFSLAENELSRRGILLAPTDEDAGAEGEGGEGAPPSGGGGDDGDGSGSEISTSGGRVIRTRADAFAHLLEAAEFLMKDDPHSPVPYMVHTACIWGEKSAPDLYKELFLEKGGQLNIFEVMGLPLNDPQN